MSTRAAFTRIEANEEEQRLTVNPNYTTAEALLDKVLSKSVAGGSNVTLLPADIMCAVLKLTGVLSANISVLMPAVEAKFAVWNATSGAFTLTFKTSAGGSTGVLIPQGATAEIFSDGTHVYGIGNIVEAQSGGLTTEQVQDIVGAMGISGSNATFTYDDATGTFTISATGGDGTGYTQEQIEDFVAAQITAGSNITVNYDDATGDITITAAGTSGITASQAQDEVSPAFASLSDGATITWDFLGKRVRNNKVTLGGNRTLSITNLVNGCTGILVVTQDGTGSRTLTLPAGSKQVGGGGTAAGLSTAVGAIDILSFVYDGSVLWWTVGKGAA